MNHAPLASVGSRARGPVGPAFVETPWEVLPAAIPRLAASGSVRLDALDEAAATEPHRQARARWSEIRAHPKLAPSP